MKLALFSYRFADEVLKNNAPFITPRAEIINILERIDLSRFPKKGKGKYIIDQSALNQWLDEQFKLHKWDYHPRITSETNLAADFRRERIQVEVQFGNMARWTYDIFKMQISYSEGTIDIGVLVVPLQWFAALMSGNVAFYERVIRELPYAKLSITLPILVIGLDPSDDGAVAHLKQSVQKSLSDASGDDLEG